MRYIAIVHTWNDGSIDYVSVLDNGVSKVEYMGGELSPSWLKERAALLRLCEINRSAKGEPFGRRFSDNMMHVYLDKKEYKQLINLIHTGATEDESIDNEKDS